MNENKLKEVVMVLYNTKDIKITPFSNTSNNEDFNLDNLLGENIQEIKLDNIDDNIFSLNTNSSTQSHHLIQLISL